MKQHNGDIHFHYLYKGFYFPDRKRLKAFLLFQLKKERREVQTINYIFCDDDYLSQMNQQYLNHDTLTDIITFELSTKGQPLLSDIYISVERVKENAAAFGVPFSSELKRVIFHGALHLTGYKDKKKTDQAIMRKKEEEWFSAYVVSRNTVS
jgi:rRNA maturation RNase YbeY